VNSFPEPKKAAVHISVNIRRCYQLWVIAVRTEVSLGIANDEFSRDSDSAPGADFWHSELRGCLT